MNKQPYNNINTAIHIILYTMLKMYCDILYQLYNAHHSLNHIPVHVYS